MAANDETGFVLQGNNTTVGGTPTSIVKKLLYDSKGQANSIIHSHPNEQTAALSFDDIERAIQQKTKGIMHQYAVSLNDVAMLDVSAFTDKQLSQIADSIKQKLFWRPDENSEYYIDEEKVYASISDNIDAYIDNILDNLKSYLDQDSTSIDFSKIKADIQSEIKETGIESYIDFQGIAEEHILSVLESKNIQYSDDMLDSISSPVQSKAYQTAIES
jgi:hypothetical protein